MSITFLKIFSWWNQQGMAWIFLIWSLEGSEVIKNISYIS